MNIEAMKLDRPGRRPVKGRGLEQGGCDFDLCHECFDRGVKERDDGPMVDPQECEREWPSFRRMLVRGLKERDFCDLRSFLVFFFGGSFPGSGLFPNLSVLLYIVCVLPVGSCSCERSFSKMKHIKSRLRSCLGEHNLELLMITSTEGPQQITNEQTDTVMNLFKHIAGTERHILL